MAGSTQSPLTPDTIVDTAERLIVNAEADAREWSLRSLSRALGCAPGALYRHFPGGVEEIFDQVRLRESRRLQSSIIAAEDDPGAPGLANLAPFSNAARLMRRCTAYLNFAAGQGAVYRHLFSQPPGASTHPYEAVVGAMIDYPATLIQAAARGRELNRTSVGRREAMALAQRIWFQLHGYADLRMNGVAESRSSEGDISLLISLLSMAGFTVAATPAGLDAAARAAMGEPDAPRRQIAG
ncbi:MAG: TetR/AcrR family transcriptional regulator [Alphaproteobacteria bacterium]